MSAELGWLWNENLEPFLEFVAGFLSYDLDPDELSAHLEQVRSADTDQDVWYRVQFPGCTLHMGRDAGTNVVFVKADGPDSKIGELRGVVSFLCCYRAVART